MSRPVILVAETPASRDALVAAADKLGIDVLASGVGPVSVADVELARANNAFIFGLLVVAPGIAPVDFLRLHSNLHDLLNDVQACGASR